MISLERLKQLLHYDPDTGVFTRLVGRSNQPAGYVAGCAERERYVCIHLDYRKYYAHRLAWFYVTGAWPKDGIDHKNGNKQDNRFANLREADQVINVQNRTRNNKNNTSGFTGVDLRYGKYRAQITANGKLVYLGMFETPERAHAEYLSAKRRLHAGALV